MKRSNLKQNMREGFSQIAPDLFLSTMEKMEIEENAFDLTEDEPSVLKRRQGKKAVIASFSGVLAACLLFFAMASYDSKHLTSVVIDVNPGVQIYLNTSYEVRKMKGTNEDGKNILNNIRWQKGEAVEAVLKKLISGMAEQSFLREGEGILISVTESQQKEFQNIGEILEDEILHELETEQIRGVSVALQMVSGEERNTGREVLEKKLQECCGLTEQFVDEMSVKEMIEYCEIQENIFLDVKEPDGGKLALSENENGITQNSNTDENTETSKEEDSPVVSNPSDADENNTQNNENENIENRVGEQKESSGEKSQNDKEESSVKEDSTKKETTKKKVSKKTSSKKKASKKKASKKKASKKKASKKKASKKKASKKKVSKKKTDKKKKNTNSNNSQTQSGSNGKADDKNSNNKSNNKSKSEK